MTNATIMRKLGNIRSKRKEFKQASPFLKESIKIYSYQFGVDSIEVVQTLLDSAYVFHKLGKHYKDIYCCTEIIDVYKKKYVGSCQCSGGWTLCSWILSSAYFVSSGS